MAASLRLLALRRGFSPAASLFVRRSSLLSSSSVSSRWLSSSSFSSEDDDAAAVSVLPEHIKFRMPDLDFEQISGGSGGVTLSKWHAKEGDAIRDGTHMCEIDTPDLVFVLDAGDEGFLARILVPADTKDVPAGQPLAIIVPTEADVARFVDALQQHPRAIEGYVEPAVSAAETTKTMTTTMAAQDDAPSSANGSSSSATDMDGGDGAAVLRQLHKLQKDGRFPDDRVFKVLKSLARKNDAQLLVTFKGSFDGAAFDADFFVETAVELVDEAFASQDGTPSH